MSDRYIGSFAQGVYVAVSLYSGVLQATNEVNLSVLEAAQTTEIARSVDDRMAQKIVTPDQMTQQIVTPEQLTQSAVYKGEAVWAPTPEAAHQIDPNVQLEQKLQQADQLDRDVGDLDGDALKKVDPNELVRNDAEDQLTKQKEDVVKQFEAMEQKHTEALAQLDEKTADHRATQETKYPDDPAQQQAHLEKFDSAAEAARDSLVSRQAAERQELEKQLVPPAPPPPQIVPPPPPPPPLPPPPDLGGR